MWKGLLIVMNLFVGQQSLLIAPHPVDLGITGPEGPIADAAAAYANPKPLFTKLDCERWLKREIPKMNAVFSRTVPGHIAIVKAGCVPPAEDERTLKINREGSL